MKTIHIKGWSNELDLVGALSDNYNLNVSFHFDEESKEVIPNVFFRFYDCAEKCSLEEALRGRLLIEFGSLELTGQEYGYSEYTVEGFSVNDARLGGHDLNQILRSKVERYRGNPRYLHILIDQVDKSY